MSLRRNGRGGEWVRIWIISTLTFFGIGNGTNIRSKRKKETKPIPTGKKFIEEEFDMKAGRKKKRARFMRGGRVDIS